MLFLMTGDFMVIPLLLHYTNPPLSSILLSFLYLPGLAFMIPWYTLCTDIYLLPSPPLPRLVTPYPFLKKLFLIRVLSG